MADDKLDRDALEQAAAEFAYHFQRLTELAGDVETMAEIAADAARALRAVAHIVGEGGSAEDAARLCSTVLGTQWSSKRIVATLADALALEGRRDALRDIVEAHRLAVGVR